MGDVWRRGRVNLVWPADSEFHGLVVECRRRPLGEVLDHWAGSPDDDRPWSELTTEQKIARTRGRAIEIASLILSWNLADDDGEPVPWPPVDPATGAVVAWPPAPGELGEYSREVAAATVLRHCDDDMIEGMRAGYASATIRVAPPLPEKSGSGPSEGSPEPEDWTPATLPAAQEVTAPQAV